MVMTEGKISILSAVAALDGDQFITRTKHRWYNRVDAVGVRYPKDPDPVFAVADVVNWPSVLNADHP